MSGFQRPAAGTFRPRQPCRGEHGSRVGARSGCIQTAAAMVCVASHDSAIAIAVRPRWRHRFGPLVLGIAAVGTLFIPIATSSGESFEKRSVTRASTPSSATS